MLVFVITEIVAVVMLLKENGIQRQTFELVALFYKFNKGENIIINEEDGNTINCHQSRW